MNNQFNQTVNQNKSDRIAARISKDKKELIKRAANLTHNSLTDFIVHTLVDKANQVIQERVAY